MCEKRVVYIQEHSYRYQRNEKGCLMLPFLLFLENKDSQVALVLPRYPQEFARKKQSYTGRIGRADTSYQTGG